MMPVRTYSHFEIRKHTYLTYAVGLPVTGFIDGSGVEVMRTDDSYTMCEGLDGPFFGTLGRVRAGSSRQYLPRASTTRGPGKVIPVVEMKEENAWTGTGRWLQGAEGPIV